MSETQHDEPAEQPKPFKQPLLRGLRMRCPSCGEGSLFYKYLKLNEHCPNCGIDIGVIRADDLPAYLTIVIVGHIVVPLAVIVEKLYAPSTAVHLAIWIPLVIVMTLLMLPVIKGAAVALMWRLGLRGDER